MVIKMQIMKGKVWFTGSIYYSSAHGEYVDEEV